ncbi:MAG: DUF4230 domain-containing protein [Clostridiales bacterium]|jgi:hypothetical protein|nr:DUF4230 domain-containing protein [Clostridiales bacterium]
MNQQEQHNPPHIVHNLKNIVLIALVVVLAITVVGLGFKVSHTTESKTTKLGFEDIGEFATQSAYCTEVSATANARKLFGHNLPFTQSNIVFSYDVVIKAGYDFSAITWDVHDTTITVKLPEVKVLSCEVKEDSFKKYVEDESIFTPFTLDDNNNAMKALKETAQTDAIANGLYENARSNAETMLTTFFSSAYDMDQYTIEFQDA